MIGYNESDFHLPQIREINAKFNKAETLNVYQVYGLVQRGRPPVRISRSEDEKPSRLKLRKIRIWLKEHGLYTETKDFGGETRDEEDKPGILIGLRGDVRVKKKFAAALVRTIVAYFEGRLSLQPTFKLPKIKLKNAGKPRKARMFYVQSNPSQPLQITTDVSGSWEQP